MTYFMHLPYIHRIMSKVPIAVAMLLLCAFFSLNAQQPDSTDTIDTTITHANTLPDVESAQESSTTSSATAPDTTSSNPADLVRDAAKETVEKLNWNISIGKIIASLIIFIIALLAIKYATKLLEAIAERWSKQRFAIKRLIPILRMLAWTVVFYIIIAGVMAPPIETLIAFTASASIALGFASQDILKNIFGGIMILFDRPFQVGDKILIGDHYGEVTQIGLRTVRIVTPDDSLVSIPNGEIMNQSVSNANVGESNCQVAAELYLPAHINFAKLKGIARRAAEISRYAYLNKPIAIILKNEIHQGRSLIKMRVKAYVLDIRYEFPFASEITEIILDEIIRQGLATPAELGAMASTTA